jgi:hypothetical protein
MDHQPVIRGFNLTGTGLFGGAGWPIVYGMKSIRYVHWQDGDMWLGYLEEFPDYMTQGETLQELEENLRDIYADLTSGAIPCVRKVAELQVP